MRHFVHGMISPITNLFAKGRIIYLFKREGEELEIEKVDDFWPYFYIRDDEGDYKDIFGEKLKKIVVEHPRDVKRLRGDFKKAWESKILFVNRFLIDRVERIEKVKLRIHFLDIEVLSEKGIEKEGEVPILSITVYDSFLEKFFCFTWGNKDFKIDDNDVILIKKSDEDEMIRSFILFEKKCFPDLIVGWNIIGYDIPYLFKRIGEDKLREISPIKEAGFDGRNYFIAGLSFFDLLDFYKKMTLQRRESYSLDSISKYEIGQGKEDKLIIKKLKNFWENEPERVIKYNINDVRLMVKIDKKIRIIDFFDEIRRVVKCTFRDLNASSRIADILLLSFSKDKFVLPDQERREKETFEGAIVKEPKRKGVLNGILVLDSSSNYPNIIETFNISPECVSSGKIKIGNVASFSNEKKGLLPEVISYLKIQRESIKKRMDKVSPDSEEFEILDLKQKVFKGLVNSLYGNLAFYGSRLYSMDVVSSITYIGRYLLRWVEDIVKRMGFEVNYADTDSLYVLVNSGDLDKLLEMGIKIQKKVNSSLNDFVKQFGVERHSLGFKLEKIYDRIFFTNVKKRYAGRVVWREGRRTEKIDIVGFEARRSDTPEILRDFQKVIFSKILNGDSKENIEVCLSRFLNDVDKKKIEWGFPVSINKNLDEYKGKPIHVRASEYSNMNFGANIKGGDQIKYYFVSKCPPFKKTDVIAIKEGFEDILDNFELDYRKIKERVLLKLNIFVESLELKKLSINSFKKVF